MKLRIRGNSVRLRLTQSEVQKIGELKPVSETVNFASQKLEYHLVPADVEKLCSDFDGKNLRVLLPYETAKNWSETDLVSLEQEASPKLLVEKDFACLTPRPGNEDDDTFAHPEKA